MDIAVTDTDVEKMISRLVSETKELLSQHYTLLKALSKELCEKGSMEAKEMAAIAATYNLAVEVKEEGYLHIGNYKQKLEK